MITKHASSLFIMSFQQKNLKRKYLNYEYARLIVIIVFLHLFSWFRLDRVS